MQVVVHPTIIQWAFGEPLLSLIPDAKAWCDANLRYRPHLTYLRQERVDQTTVIAKFSDDVDALMFKMRWCDGIEEEAE